MSIELNLKFKKVLEKQIKPGEEVSAIATKLKFYLENGHIVSDYPAIPLDFHIDTNVEIGLWYDEEVRKLVLTVFKIRESFLEIYVSSFSAKDISCLLENDST